jgi:hypothetical protein
MHLQATLSACCTSTRLDINRWTRCLYLPSKETEVEDHKTFQRLEKIEDEPAFQRPPRGVGRVKIVYDPLFVLCSVNLIPHCVRTA